MPYRLKKYRFFDIGNDHYYFDDFNNDEIITRVARNSYIPATQMLLDIIKNNGKKFTAEDIAFLAADTRSDEAFVKAALDELGVEY